MTRAQRVPFWRLFTVLSAAYVLGAIPPPATHAASQVPTLLRYAFQQGRTYTMHFSLTSTETIKQPRYADRHFHEVTTGLEQSVTAQVFADDAALFQYHFAGLRDTGSAGPASLVLDRGGPPTAVSGAQYVITQAVGADGHAEAPTQQCNPTAGLDDLAPFTLLPLAPVSYGLQPVAVGNTWIASLPPDDGVTPQAHVQWIAKDGSSGRFQETATVPIHIEDAKNYLHLSGTTLMTTSVTQNLVTRRTISLEFPGHNCDLAH